MTLLSGLTGKQLAAQRAGYGPRHIVFGPRFYLVLSDRVNLSNHFIAFGPPFAVFLGANISLK